MGSITTPDSILEAKHKWGTHRCPPTRHLGHYTYDRPNERIGTQAG